MGTPELEVIKDIPGYRVILKAVLKSQIQQLVEHLAAHTDEESVILTASVSDGTLSHLGSDSGKTFLEDHEDIKSQFLGFCLRKHHKKKQQEKEKQEREEAMRMMPTTPSRQPGPRFSPRSPRFPSPRQQGVYPMALTRASPARMRSEPYQRPMKRPLNFEPQGPTPPNQPPVRMPMSGQVIKIEAEDPDESDTSNVDSNAQTRSGDTTGAASSQPSSPSRANTENTHSAAAVKAEASEKDDDAKSTSSTSTIPNEASDLKLGDSAPPEGLSLDSDLSSLIPPTEDSSGGDNQQPETPHTPSSAPHTPGSSSGLDSSVSVKVEAITESEMELEITGVELGPRPVQRGNSQEGWGPNVPGGGMGFSGGAAGSQADLQQGYSLQNKIRLEPARTKSYTFTDTPHPKPDLSATSEHGQLSSEVSSTYFLSYQGSQLKVEMCGVCGKHFPTKWDLERHSLVHTGEKPFRCDYCDFRSARRDNLKTHMRKKHDVTLVT